MTRKLKSERFTTYREKNSKILSFKEELENLNSFNERKQFSKKDSTSEDTEFTDEETKQLVIEIL